MPRKNLKREVVRFLQALLQVFLSYAMVARLTAYANFIRGILPQCGKSSMLRKGLLVLFFPICGVFVPPCVEISTHSNWPALCMATKSAKGQQSLDRFRNQ